MGHIGPRNHCKDFGFSMARDGSCCKVLRRRDLESALIKTFQRLTIALWIKFKLLALTS